MSRERVLVTGGAAGIGAAIADRCRADGYETITLDRRGGDINVDVTDITSTLRLIEEALQDGPITRLVNNVGAVRHASVADQTEREMRESWDLNVQSALTCLQPLLPGMKENHFGRVVNMSSRASLGKPLRTAYAGTKAALIGMSRVWALELGAHGITVNAVAPGPIKTQLFEDANPEGSPLTESIINSIPVGRMGEPSDIAQATSFFLDDASSFVTGQTLYVCGGLTVGTNPI